MSRLFSISFFGYIWECSFLFLLALSSSDVHLLMTSVIFIDRAQTTVQITVGPNPAVTEMKMGF